MADIVRPLGFLGQVSLIRAAPHLDRARAKVELVDGAINMKILKPVQSHGPAFGLPVEKYRVNPRCHEVVSRPVSLHAYIQSAGSTRGPTFLGGTQ